MDPGLAQRFYEYSAWRANLASRISAYRKWLNENQLSDAQIEMRLDQLLARLQEDKLTIAFVAEFSRGKSELINALFFADYGKRLLPSAAGRTTMCPTELLWDSKQPPRIQLLPIETRAVHAATGEFKRFPDEWVTIELDLQNTAAMSGAFQRVRDTKRVPAEQAQLYGLQDHQSAADSDGMVEIPCWRYAIINFPHPLLAQGVVILDTPGLNAIGTEPELTLNLLPNAHAALFLLACDTGVTESDADVWRRHLAVTPNRHASRLVVLNKIDALWDGLRTEEEIADEINSQRVETALTLGLPPERVIAASAQKGLLAKINGDDALLARSGLLDVERKLADELIPGKQHIVREAARSDLDELLAGTRSILHSRLHNVYEQLEELRQLRGRNLGVVEGMMSKVRNEKEAFEKGLQRFVALRRVFAQQTDALFTSLGMDAVAEEGRRTLNEMRAKMFTPGLRTAMANYFDTMRGKLGHADERIVDIYRMMDAMYKKFSAEHGLRLDAPPADFSMLRYHKEFDRLERNFRTHFDTALTMLTHEKLTLMQKFFETLASQVRRVYEFANRDVDAWLRAILAPMETQVHERQLQLRQRLESIKRIHRATDQLEVRVAELEQMELELNSQLEGLAYIAADMTRVLDLQELPLAVAA